MVTAEAGDGREPQGLGPRARRSAATGDMAAAAATGAREEERQREREVPLLYVLALSVALPLPIAVSRMDAGVPRKARTIWNWPRAKPTGWWAFRLPVPLVKEARPPRPKRQRMRSGLGAPDLGGTAATPAVERPAKKAKRCVQCGTSETPQWRSGPMGRSTLCNSCGVRLRASGALRGKVRRPPPPPVSYKAASPPPPPPDSPASDSPPDSPICVCRVPPGDVYLVRKQPKRETGTPGKEEAAPPPSPSPEPATHLVKKNKKKPSRPRNTGQRCLHCGTTSTPQWRSGPMGRHTLCNACGVRYRQGRLLPEYRPATSPTFVPSKHASRHREVLQLHRRRRQQDKSRQLAKRPSSDDGLLPDLRAGDDDPNNVFLLRRQRPDKEPYPPTPPHRPLPPQPRPVDGNNNNDGAVLAGCSCGDNQTPGGSLDSLLLDGPSAPLIVDESLVR